MATGAGTILRRRKGWVGWGYARVASTVVLFGAAVACAVLPVEWDRPVVGHVPVQPGEHPRLLLRASDIPSLRERGATLDGRRIVATVRDLNARAKNGFEWGAGGGAPPYAEGAWALGEGLMYLLTGEQPHADRAQDLAALAMTRNGGEWGAWGTALRDAYTALTYDVCYGAWDEEFRRAVAEFLRHRSGNPRGNRNQYDVFDVMWQAGFGLAGLAVAGDPYPPVKPGDPAEAIVVDPPQGFTPGNGVPVLPFTAQTPTQWIVVKAFDLKEQAPDPLASIGGRASARPALGDKVSTKFGEFEWKAHANESKGIYLYNFGGEESKLVDDARTDKALSLYAYLYTVIDNDAERVVKAQPNAWLGQLGGGTWGTLGPTYGSSMWIAGTRVKNGDLLKLGPGKYPLLVEVPLDMGLWQAAHLIDYSGSVHEAAMAAYQAELDAYTANGNRMAYVDERLSDRKEWLGVFLRDYLGEKGLPSEQSNQTDMFHNLLPFLQAYRNTIGNDISTGTGAEWVVPFQMHSRQRYWHCDWGTDFWRTMGFRDLVPARYRPALRSMMADHPSFGISLPGHGFFALLNYPWDVEAKSPAAAGLPLYLWDSKGALVLKNGWNEDTDFSVVVQTRASWTKVITAGDVTVYGRRGNDRWTGFTQQGGGWSGQASVERVTRPSVLRLSDALPYGATRNTYCAASETDGSGIVSFVQEHWVKADPVALGTNTLKDGADQGIAALRSIAVDFSGASGSPLLVAIVDKVEGAAGRGPFQQFNFSRGGRKGNVIATSGSTFTVTANDASVAERLTGEVIVPSSPVLARGAGENGDLLHISGGADAYFTVYTIQSGPMPEITVSGAGLDATVKIGNQSISFDGERLVLGTFTGTEQRLAVSAYPSPRSVQPAGLGRGLAPSSHTLLFDLRGRLIARSRPKAHARGVHVHLPVARDHRPVGVAQLRTR